VSREVNNFKKCRNWHFGNFAPGFDVSSRIIGQEKAASVVHLLSVV
jgi:hypothetical protein